MSPTDTSTSARPVPPRSGVRPPASSRARRDRRSRHPKAESAVGRSLGDHLERGFRPDIEGLRALAVIAVIVYHAHVFGVSGGFIGVDVFFVLSGFLITRLILDELSRSGTLDLPRFWGRRARRLLPASALTVLVTLLGAHWLMPPLTQQFIVPDVVGAATFTSNFVFAHRLGGYFGAQLGASTPSPLLHFWSLAVEEQFYLLWPPLLLVLTRRPRQYRRLLLATIAGLGTVGFVLAAWLTPRSPSWAFYLLPARMGELLVGAVLAVLGAQVRRISPTVRAGLAVAGLGTIAWAGWSFDHSTPWPGVAVFVPVLATAAVIVGGDVRGPAWAPRRWLAADPLQWIGRHSYALYLWHWPALVLADARWGPLDWMQRVSAVAVAVGLSAVSVQFLEDPVRHSRFLAAVNVRSLALGGALMALVLGSAWAFRTSVPSLEGGQLATAPVLAPVPAGAPAVDPASLTPAGAPTGSVPAVAGSLVPPSVVGVTTVVPTTAAPTTSMPAPTTVPVALDLPPAPRGDLAALVASMQATLATAAQPTPLPSNLRPSLGQARERSRPYQDGCVNVGVNQRLQPCEYGVAGAERTILLYGDSHAAQWFEPLEAIARDRGFRLVLLNKGGCPVTDVVVPTPVLRHTCPPYRDGVIAWIAQHQPALVVVSNSYTQYDDDDATWAAGAEATMARLAAVASNVVVIGDSPSSNVDPPACLSGQRGDVMACATSREQAVHLARISGEYVAAHHHGFTFVDTSDWFCGPSWCPPVVGDLLVLRDETHITPPMAEFLRPLLEASLSTALATAAG